MRKRCKYYPDRLVNKSDLVSGLVLSPKRLNQVIQAYFWSIPIN
jgi:hypothetical protein